MVAAIKTMLVDKPITERARSIVEIVGPAGAGKTTILLALSQRNQKIRPIFRLRSNPKYVPCFVSNALSLLPHFLNQLHDRRSYTWREINWMIRLKALHHVLGLEALEYRTVIIDQGPIYTLRALHEFGSENAKRVSFERWWNRMLKQWASTLDMVIWLDASDEILVERIRARDKWHLLKEKSDHEAKKFLSGYRASYEQTISKLTADGRPRVLRFDTDQDSLDQIVDRVVAEVDFESNES